MRNLLIFIFLCILLPQPIISQDTGQKEVDGRYREFYIGMSLEECKIALENDGFFYYSREEVPSIMVRSEEVLLDCPGRSFISRGWFQFNQDILVVMTIQLNTDKIDYYSMYKRLSESHGEPQDLSPQRALWRNSSGDREVELSRPLQVKFTDRGFIDSLIEDSRARESYDEMLREQFLEDF